MIQYQIHYNKKNEDWIQYKNQVQVDEVEKQINLIND
jgi:hypothetical protein